MRSACLPSCCSPVPEHCGTSLSLQGVRTVINFDMPEEIENYVHRWAGGHACVRSGPECGHGTAARAPAWTHAQNFGGNILAPPMPCHRLAVPSAPPPPSESGAQAAAARRVLRLPLSTRASARSPSCWTSSTCCGKPSSASRSSCWCVPQRGWGPQPPAVLWEGRGDDAAAAPCPGAGRA